MTGPQPVDTLTRHQAAVQYITAVAAMLDAAGDPHAGGLRQAVRILLGHDQHDRLCKCGCGRPLQGRARDWYSDACRKRAARR